MIPRYQKVLFVLLLVASVGMGVLLWHLLDRAHQRLLQGEASTPTKAPAVAPAVQATLYVANDADNSLQPQVLALPLPASPNERAQAVLGKLLDLYATPGATHPVPGGASSIAQVFLLPVPAAGSGAAAPHGGAQDAPELAVINLTAAFANNHPSGLETETLTVLSLCATLHAVLPQVAQVRFLVDGQPRATLAGHTDLSRIYLTTETMTSQ